MLSELFTHNATIRHYNRLSYVAMNSINTSIHRESYPHHNTRLSIIETNSALLHNAVNSFVRAA